MKAIATLLLIACQATSHPVQPGAAAPSSSTFAELNRIIETPGTVEVERVDAADWAVDLGGLLNLKHPKAKELQDHLEPIHIYFYALRHPTQGLYLIDTGMEDAISDTDKS